MLSECLIDIVAVVEKHETQKAVDEEASQGFDPASAPLGVDAKHGAKSLGRWPQNFLPDRIVVC